MLCKVATLRELLIDAQSKLDTSQKINMNNINNNNNINNSFNNSNKKLEEFIEKIPSSSFPSPSSPSQDDYLPIVTSIQFKKKRRERSKKDNKKKKK